MTRSVVIVGAGLAGLACARALVEGGCAVTVLDKGRRPGGRACSRRDDAGGGFDHGAQYFTARGAWLARQVEDWERAGAVARWTPRVARGASVAVPREPWWVGTPDMGALASHLARGLDVRASQKVVAVERRDGRWTISTEGAAGASAVQARTLVLAIPAAQCAPLLASVSTLAGPIAAVTQTPCWAAMVELRMAAPVEVDAFDDRDGVIAWAAREASKPGRPATAPDGAIRWTLHASTAWSEAHLEEPAAQVGPALAAAFLDRFPRGAVEVTQVRAHRWRYARGEASAAPVGAWFDRSIDLAVCGDWLASARVEGALASGRAAAAGLLDGGVTTTVPT